MKFSKEEIEVLRRLAWHNGPVPATQDREVTRCLWAMGFVDEYVALNEKGLLAAQDLPTISEGDL